MAPLSKLILPALAAVAVADTTYSGYLIDWKCYSDDGGRAADGSHVITGPAEHTRACLMMQPCEDSGYYLAKNMGTADAPNYRPFLSLDAAGNTAAAAFLAQDSRESGILVTASGTHSGDGTLVGATVTACTGDGCDGVCTGNCQVTTTYSGYLIDFACYTPTGLAMDGSNVITDPAAHTVACLLMQVCIDSGYYLAMNNGNASSPSYHPFLNLNTPGNWWAEQILRWSGRTNNYLVTASGNHIGNGILDVNSIGECTGNCDGVCTGNCVVVHAAPPFPSSTSMGSSWAAPTASSYALLVALSAAGLVA